MDIKNLVVDFLFPGLCLGCEVRGGILCGKCVEKLQFVDGFESDDDFCFDHLRWCLKYDDLFRKLIIDFKYKRLEGLSAVFGEFLGRLDGFERGSVVVPVPISSKRLNDRGFNQARLLALYFCTFHPGLEFFDCLGRKFDRPKQSLLGRDGRLHNLEGSIDLNADVRGRNIILVDDVATTCSTLNECSRVLKNGGARKICCVVLARA